MQVKKIQDNRWWFKNNVSGFKVPNRVSRLALDSPRISIGEHQLPVDADLKEVALTVSSILVLFFVLTGPYLVWYFGFLLLSL